MLCTRARKVEQQWPDDQSVAVQPPVRSFVLISQLLIKPQLPGTKKKKKKQKTRERKKRTREEREEIKQGENRETRERGIFPYPFRVTNGDRNEKGGRGETTGVRREPTTKEQTVKDAREREAGKS